MDATTRGELIVAALVAIPILVIALVMAGVLG